MLFPDIRTKLIQKISETDNEDMRLIAAFSLFHELGKL